MATERPAVGIAHYTVVPENFKSKETTIGTEEQAMGRES